MPSLELVSFTLCPYVQRAAIVLHEKGVPFTRTDVDLANKPAWFLAISPTGRVPLLRVDGRHVLFESAAIAEYLDETLAPRLMPEDPVQRAVHRAWIAFASDTLSDIAALYNAPDAAGFAPRHAALRVRFQKLDAVLDPAGPFFAGGAFSLVDAAFAPVFRYFVAMRDDLPDAFPRVAAWKRALAARASVRAAVVPDFTDRLSAWLLARNSHLSERMRQARAA